MAVSVISLRAAHREFAEADHPTDAEVQAAIDAAERHLDQAALGVQHDDAVRLMACQFLARSPYAQDLRLEKSGYTTIFDEPLRALLEPLGRAWRILP